MKFWFTFILSTVLVLASDQDLILEIEKSLMAPCCWSGTVYDHGNPDMESEITNLAAEGKSKQEIINYFVHEKRIILSDGRIRYGYGEKILAMPAAKGFNLLVWIVPSLLAVAAFIILGLYIKAPKKTIVSPVARHTPEIPFDEEIERELKELD